MSANILNTFNEINIVVAPGADVEKVRAEISASIMATPYTPDPEQYESERDFWGKYEIEKYSQRLKEILTITEGAPDNKTNLGNGIQSIGIETGVSTTRGQVIDCALHLSSLIKNAPVSFTFNNIDLKATAPASAQAVENQYKAQMEKNLREAKHADALLKASQPKPVELVKGMVVAAPFSYCAVLPSRDERPDVRVEMGKHLYILKDLLKSVPHTVLARLNNEPPSNTAYSQESLATAKQYFTPSRHGYVGTDATEVVKKLMQTDPAVNKLVGDLVQEEFAKPDIGLPYFAKPPANYDPSKAAAFAGKNLVVVETVKHRHHDTGQFSSGGVGEMVTTFYLGLLNDKGKWKMGDPVLEVAEGEWFAPPEPVRNESGEIVKMNLKKSRAPSHTKA